MKKQILALLSVFLFAISAIIVSADRLPPNSQGIAVGIDSSGESTSHPFTMCGQGCDEIYIDLDNTGDPLTYCRISYDPYWDMYFAYSFCDRDYIMAIDGNDYNVYDGQNGGLIESGTLLIR